METVGFIGLGQMGLPMATRLASAGYSLVVQDSDVRRMETLGVGRTDSIRDAKAAGGWGGVDFLITMLPNSAIVEAVLIDGGVAKSLKNGALVIDMSSSEPMRSRELCTKLKAMGLDYIDAPVSGGVKRAAEGSLAIMAGGSAAHIERANELLLCMGSKVFNVGPAGSGHAAKALNNYVSAAGLVATVECLLAAETFGIDPYVMTDVLNASSGRSNTTENKVKQFILNGSFASGFALKLMAKDVRIAHELIHELKTASSLADANRPIWDAAAEKVDASADHTAIYKLMGSD